MTANTIGKNFSFTTWGESHGTAIGCVVDGTPSQIVRDQWENGVGVPQRISAHTPLEECMKSERK